MLLLTFYRFLLRHRAHTHIIVRAGELSDHLFGVKSFRRFHIPSVLFICYTVSMYASVVSLHWIPLCILFSRNLIICCEHTGRRRIHFDEETELNYVAMAIIYRQHKLRRKNCCCTHKSEKKSIKIGKYFACCTQLTQLTSIKTKQNEMLYTRRVHIILTMGQEERCGFPISLLSSSPGRNEKCFDMFIGYEIGAANKCFNSFIHKNFGHWLQAEGSGCRRGAHTWHKSLDQKKCEKEVRQSRGSE